MSVQKKVMECKFCGAVFEESLTACPYCESTNIKAAEAEYMEKLEDIRTDMENLGELPVEETKKSIKKQVRFVVILFIVLGAVLFALGLGLYLWNKYSVPERDLKADYIWETENFPMFDELYQQEKYDELVEKYMDACTENRSIYNWEHQDFAAALCQMKDCEAIWDKEKAGKALDEWDYSVLIYTLYRVEDYETNPLYSGDEKERMQPYIKMVREDAERRWEFSEEEWQQMENEVRDKWGSVDILKVEKWIKSWMKRSEK